jgi:hypothetical protein
MSVSAASRSSIQSYGQKTNRMSNPGLETIPVGFLIVAGGGSGGGGGGWYGGGGGAGGFITSEGTSGGNTSAVPKLQVKKGEGITVTVGAGATGNTQTDAQKGGNSVVGYLISYGGGTGNRFDSAYFKTGGSGGGAGNISGGRGEFIINQGSFGGSGGQGGSGGGGAGGIGGSSVGYGGGAAGIGLASSITGSSVTYSVGGAGNGGSAGGANTGNGGAGGLNNGGSGIIVLKYPDNIAATIGVGLTSSTTTSGGFKITTFTAGTGTVTFN